MSINNLLTNDFAIIYFIGLRWNIAVEMDLSQMSPDVSMYVSYLIEKNKFSSIFEYYWQRQFVKFGTAFFDTPKKTKIYLQIYTPQINLMVAPKKSFSPP